MPESPLLFGLLTTQDLEAIFSVTDDTITRAVQRGDLPPPLRLFGRHVWSIAVLQTHFTERLEAARVAQAKEHAAAESKVKALYGGTHHGRRS